MHPAARDFLLARRVSLGGNGAAGWIVTGLDGRAQLLNGKAEPLASVGGWGSQIVGLQSACGGGWQILASQAQDLNQSDAVLAFEIVNRKPMPVSAPLVFAGPIIELWPLASGSEALAISRNLRRQPMKRFAYRLLAASSVACLAFAAGAATRPRYGGTLHVEIQSEAFQLGFGRDRGRNGSRSRADAARPDVRSLGAPRCAGTSRTGPRCFVGTR